MRVAVTVALALAWSSLAVAKPRATVLVIDRSLEVEKLELVRSAIVESLPEHEAGNQVAVVSVGKAARVEASLQAPKSRALAKAIDSIAPAIETADLTSGLEAALRALARSKLSDRRILVISNRDAPLSAGATVAKIEKARIRLSSLSYQATTNAPLVSRGSVYAAKDRSAVIEALAAERSSPTRKPIAVTYVIDRSGSQRATLELEKAIARATLARLTPDDYVAVVAFDSEAALVVRPQRFENRERIAAEIGRIEIQGGTNIYVGLKEAFEVMQTIRADVVKHVILFSDGGSPTEGIVEMVNDMRVADVQVSAIGTPNADRGVLSMIADAGDGRLLLVDDINQILHEPLF
jgi:secreted protein with Ig-like and vWFA domain